MANSPAVENLPLRENSMCYQPSPSALSQTSPLTSPPPESAFSGTDAEGFATLTWQDIKVVVTTSSSKLSSTNSSQEQRIILDGVTGFAEPSRMVTIMGPSKSGKSTLLRTLAGRLTSNARYQGDILINGRRQQLTYGASAFLTSEDEVLPDFLTVKEHLCLSAFLRLPSSLPRKERLAVAEHIMVKLGLNEVAYRYVKLCQHTGINAGDRRILGLATELLIGPYLIYLDDPLHGLRGASALRMLLKLKGLSRGGCTVIFSVDHTCSHVYELLDDVCLLSSGKMVYMSAIEHFTGAGFPCPPLHNPGDHFLYTIAGEYEKLRAPYQYVQDTEKAEAFAYQDNQNIVQLLSTSYKNSDLYTALVSRVHLLAKKKGGVLVGRTKPAGFCTEMSVLTYRSLLNTTREMGFYWTRLCLSVLLMLAIGTIFLKLDHSRSSIEARASCIFLALEGMLFLSIGGMPYYFGEIKMHMKEMTNCEYGVAKFVLANWIASLPFLLLISLVPLCSMYFLVGLHPGVFKFIYFVTNLYLSLMASESLIMAISTAVPNVYSGIVVGTCIQFLFMLVGGYIRHINDFPKPFWKFPVSYVSFHAHSLRGMFENEFLDSHVGGHTGTYIVREDYHMNELGKWWSLFVVAAMMVIYRLIAILSIKLTRKHVVD